MFWKNAQSLYRQAAYSFEVELGNKANAGLWYAKSVVLPAFEQEIINDLVEGQSVKSHGPATWQPVVIELYDIAPRVIETDDVTKFEIPTTGPSTSFMAWATANNLIDEKRMRRTANYQNAAQHSWYATDFTTGVPITGIIGGVKIRKIYKSGVQDRGTEEWILENPIMSAITFGTLDVSSEDTLLVTMTFDYQRVNYTLYEQRASIVSTEQ